MLREHVPFFSNLFEANMHDALEPTIQLRGGRIEHFELVINVALLGSSAFEPWWKTANWWACLDVIEVADYLGCQAIVQRIVDGFCDHLTRSPPPFERVVSFLDRLRGPFPRLPKLEHVC